jgi:hypothetical protein
MVKSFLCINPPALSAGRTFFAAERPIFGDVCVLSYFAVDRSVPATVGSLAFCLADR